MPNSSLAVWGNDASLRRSDQGTLATWHPSPWCRVAKASPSDPFFAEGLKTAVQHLRQISEVKKALTKSITGDQHPELQKAQKYVPENGCSVRHQRV